MVGRDRLSGEVRVEPGEDDSDCSVTKSSRQKRRRRRYAVDLTSRWKEDLATFLYQVPSSSTPE